ncbi:MAG TPA: ATP-binding cassette domain-containing protein [Candidatus Onthoplasma faecipullorum]|nr:ATP-binding cassette domain-containing protein [Candidatus Onthoplasma faecipullorum]
MIEFNAVTIKYVPDVTTLLNFNLKINGNTLIIGDEFLGTSSILRLLAKIDKNYEGDIFIEGVNLKDIKDRDLSIAYIPKEPYLFNHKSIEKNLGYPLKIRKIDKATAKEKVNFALNLINNLTQKYNLPTFSNKINKMNISEKKIITLLRASLRTPKYILIDDFFINLNEKYQPLVAELIKQLEKTSTIIATTSIITNLPYKNYKYIDLVN